MEKMNKLIILSCLLLVLGTVLIAGCLDSDSDNSLNDSNNTNIPPIADAALYRGNVINVEDDNGQLTVTLEQVAGTNFGAAEMNFLITENTNISFNQSEIVNGKYMEIYYGPTEGSSPTAIVVNLLPDADKCVYNGVLEDFTPDEDSQSGTITLKLNDSEAIMVFAYSSSTQFYLTVSDLQQGDMLNIYTSGSVSDTEPPQTGALEVRMYR